VSEWNAWRDGSNERPDLRGAYLRGADLRGAYLRVAVLYGAYLYGANLNWKSHMLLSELLRRAAGESVERRSLAGLIRVSIDWCWDDFLERIEDPHKTWALKELAKWVKEGNGAPECVTQYVEAAPQGDST
jgi:hypothetical protein